MTVTWRRLASLDALALTALIWFLAKFLRYAFPPLFGTLQATYGVSNTVLGTAFGALMLAYALTQFPSGALADDVGMVRVITAGALLAAVASLSLVVPAGFVALVGGMVLVGVGTGAHKTVAVGLMGAVYPERTGRALGAMDTFGAFGGVVAPAAVVALTGPGERWRLLFLAAGLVGVVLAVLFAVRVPRRLPARSENDGRSSRGLRQYGALFSDRRLVAFVAVTVLFSFAYNGVVAFLPLYLARETALSSDLAGLLYGGLFLVSVVQPATGELGDRIGPLPVVVATLALATAGLLALLATATPLAVVAAVLALGVGSHGFRPVRAAYLLALVPASTAGGALGVVRTLLMGAGAFSPALVGYLSDSAGFTAAFAVLAASLAGAFALSLALLR